MVVNVVVFVMGVIAGVAIVIVPFLVRAMSLWNATYPKKTWEEKFAERYCEYVKGLDEDERRIVIQAFTNRRKGEDDTYE